MDRSLDYLLPCIRQNTETTEVLYSGIVSVNEIDVSAGALLDGNNRSCGCLKDKNQKQIAQRRHLVDGTCVEVLEKRKKRRDNESGFRGVFYLKNSNRYRVDIGFKGKRYYVGLFEDYDEAVQARLEAENLIHNSFINIWKEWNQKEQEDPQWGKEHPLVFNVRKVNGELQVEAGCQEIKTS